MFGKQNGGTFHSFHEEEIGELLAKNTAKTVRRELDGRHDICYWRIFAELSNHLSPKLADTHALSKMNLTSIRGKHVLACF